MVTVKQSSHLRCNPQAFLSYFLSCPVEEGEWESGWVDIWQPSHGQPTKSGSLNYLPRKTALEHREKYYAINTHPYQR